MDGISQAPKMVAADVPERGRIYYLIDDQYDFIPEAKAFFDWNAATNRAPATVFVKDIGGQFRINKGAMVASDRDLAHQIWGPVASGKSRPPCWC